MRHDGSFSRMSLQRGYATALVAAVVVTVLGGCASTSESVRRDTLTAQVGVFPPPPSGLKKVKLGIPSFTVDPPRGVSISYSFSARELENMAADQLTTMLFGSGRFEVIERAQLHQLINEQRLAGIVKAGQVPEKGQVEGVDYLLLGKVSGIRMTATRKSTSYGIGPGRIAQELGGFTGGVDLSEVLITTEMGVDLRIVEPATGRIKTAHFSQFQHQETAKSMGARVMGVGGGGKADISVSRDEFGKILRLALDDTVRKMLPDVDSQILTPSTPSSSLEQPGVVTADKSPSAGVKFCDSCGAKLGDGAKFCGQCGKKIE